MRLVIVWSGIDECKGCCFGVDLGKVEITFPNAICLVIFYVGCSELSFNSVVIEHIGRLRDV